MTNEETTSKTNANPAPKPPPPPTNDTVKTDHEVPEVRSTSSTPEQRD